MSLWWDWIAPDAAVWTYAQTADCIIVSKDADFSDMSVVRGLPPKVIWLRLGNCSTNDIEQTLRSAYTQITAFANDVTVGVLEIV